VVPRCNVCWRPVATEEDYDRYEEGEGEHLCWEVEAVCVEVADREGWPTTYEDAMLAFHQMRDAA
jgi:hypothetical protein